MLLDCVTSPQLCSLLLQKQSCVGSDELLLILLLEWRRRYPIANKRLLAKALANCGQYAEATKLDAARKLQLEEFSNTYTDTSLEAHALI